MKYKTTEKDRYGNMRSIEITTDGQLEVPPMTSMIPQYEAVGGLAENHPGEPRGSDTVPAWLTPGEFVVNKEATDMYGPLIKKMNDEGRKVQDMKEPMYAKEGKKVDTSWITPDLLEKLAFIESDGIHRDPSKAGQPGYDHTGLRMSPAKAYGKYQWTVDAASKPGFGVKGFDPREISEEIMREKTYQYLVGMQKEFPHWPPEDVLRAYNYGPTKTRELKDGYWDTDLKSPNYGKTIIGPDGMIKFRGMGTVPEEAKNYPFRVLAGDKSAVMPISLPTTKPTQKELEMLLVDPPLRENIPGGLIVKDIPRPDSDSKSIGRTVMDAAQEGIADTIDTIKSIPSYFTKGAEDTKARFNKRKELFTKPNDKATPESAFNLDIGGLIPGIDFPSDPRDNEENFIKKMLGYDDRTSSPTPVTDPGFQDYGEMIPRFPINYDPQGLGGMPEMEKIDPTFQNILRQTVPAPVPSYDPQGLGGDEFIPEVTPNNMLMNPNAMDDLGRNNDMTSIMGGDKSLADAFAPAQIPEPFGMDDPNLMKAMEESFTNEQAYDGTPPEGIGMGMPEPAYTSMYDKMVQDELTGSPEYEIPEVMSMDPQGIGGDELIPASLNKSFKPNMLEMDGDILSNINLPTDTKLASELAEKEKVLAMEMKYLTYYRDVEPDAKALEYHRGIVNKLQDQIKSIKGQQDLKEFREDYTPMIKGEKQKIQDQISIGALQKIISSDDATQTEKDEASNKLKEMNVQTPEEIAEEKEKAKLATLAGKVDTNLEAAMTNDLTSADGQAATTNASQNEPEVSKARKMFDFLFGDMIDSGEIGRAIGVYLGSRALGYDHGSSIGYVAKQYLKRIDAKNAAWDKWSRENMTKFTPASMAKFKRTRNPNHLIPIGNPIRSTGKRQTYYHPTLGKGQAFEFKVANSNGDDTTYWSFDQSGKNQDLVLGPGWTSENVLDVSTEEINLIEKMLSGFQSKYDKVTTGSKAKGTQKTKYFSSMSSTPGVVPAAAAAEVAQWLHERGIPPGKFKEPIAEAYKLLIEHNKQRAAEGEDSQIQNSLLPFLQESTVKLRLEDMSYIDDNGKKRLIPSPIKGKIGDEIRTMDTKVLMKLEREISTFFPAGTEDRFWAQAAKAWMNSSETRKEFEEAAKKKVNSEYTPFSLFAQALIGNELQKAAANATQ